MSEPTKIVLGMDISEVVTNTAKLLGLTKQQKAALKELTETTIHLNEEGQAQSGYIEQQINASQRLITTVHNAGTEEESYTRKIVATSEAINRQRDAVQALLSATNRAATGKIAVTSVGGSYTTNELAKIEKIKTAIGKLDTEVVKPGVIKDFFDSIKKGEIPEATGALAKLRDELVKLQNIRESVKARSVVGKVGYVDRDAELKNRAVGRASVFQQRYEGQFVDPLAATFGINKDDLTAEQAARVRKIGSNIARVLRQNVVEDKRDTLTADKLKDLVPDLTTGKKLDFAGRPEVQAASDQISKLIALFERLKKAKDAAASAAGPKPVDPVKAAADAAGAKNASDFRSQFQSKFLSELETQFKVDTGTLSLRQEAVLKRASGSIAKTIKDGGGGLDVNKVNDIFNTIRAGGAITAPEGSDLAKVSSELSKIIGLYERLRQEKDREAKSGQGRENKRLLSSAEDQRAEARIQSIQNRVERTTRPLDAQLKGVDPTLGLDQSKITTITRRIAELAQKADLGQRSVLQLYERFQNGSLTQADGQFSRLIAQFQKLDNVQDKAKGAANLLSRGQKDASGKFTNGSAPLPFPEASGAGKLPPNTVDIENAKNYSGIYDKIKGTLEYFLVYKGFNFLTNQLTQAFDEARKFQIQVSLIRTISQDSQQSVSATAAQLVRVSNSTGIGLNEVATAAYEAVSNQITKGKQTEAFVKTAGELARTTNSSLADSVNLLSGAINSYGFDAGDAEEISAKFFKAIDIGKIKASELANTFGRVAFVGRDLGVSFDEILGTLSTLTQKGVTTDDAVTLLTNGMSKLTNPTEKTKQVLKEMGFESGQAAVRVLGFTEVMKRLTEQVSNGRLELTDLFNEIRGEKFASAFKTFNADILQNTKTIGKESFGTYAEAKDLRGESDADKINKQINELKNTLSQTFGNELTALVKSLIDASGGVENFASNIERLTRIAIIAGGAFLVYKGSILAAQLATGIYNGVVAISTGVTLGATRATSVLTGTRAASTGVTALQTVGTVANTAAMNQNRAAYIGHPIGLLLAAGAALYAYYETQNTQLIGVNEKLQTLNDGYKAFAAAQKTIAQDKSFESYGKSIDEAKDKLGEAGKRIAENLAKANGELDIAKTRATSTGAALKEGFDKYTNFMKDRISDVSREYNKLDDRIKNSSKAILNFREIAQRQRYEFNLKYSGGFEYDQFLQREKLEVAEKKRLETEIRKLFSSGTDEDVQKARQLGAELLAQNKNIEELRQSRSQGQFDEDVKKNPQNYRPDQYGKVYRGVSDESLVKENDKSVKFLEDLENKYQSKVKAKAQTDEGSLIQKKAELLRSENAIKALDNVKIFDKGGGINVDFQDKVTGRADFPKIRAALFKAATDAKKSLDPEALKRLGPEIDRLIGERLVALDSEISAADKVDALRQSQNKATEAVKGAEKAFQDGKKAVKDYGVEIEGVSHSIDGLLEGLKQFTGDQVAGLLAQNTRSKDTIIGGGTQFQRRLTSGLEKGAKLLGDVGEGIGVGSNNDNLPLEQAKKRLQPIKDEIESIQKELQKPPTKGTDKDGIPLIDGGKVQNTLDRITKLKETIRGLAKEIGGADNIQVPGLTQGLGQLDEYEKSLRETLRSASVGYNQSILDLNTLRDNSKLLTADLGATLTQLGQITPAAATGLGGAAKPFQDLSKEVAALNLKLDEAIGKLGQLGKSGVPTAPAAPAAPAGPVPQDAFPIPAQPKMLGGMIDHYAAGGAVGSDNQQVYAQAGEYIWNRTATRQYYSQIQAMNGRGRTPVEFSNTTNGDTINVGGININESKNGQGTASDMMNMIRRHQRRG